MQTLYQEISRQKVECLDIAYTFFGVEKRGLSFKELNISVSDTKKDHFPH